MKLKELFIDQRNKGYGIFSSLFSVMNKITGGPIRTTIIGLVSIGAAIKGISDAIENAKFEKATELTDNFDEAKTSIDDYKVKINELKTELESGNLTEQEAYDKKSQLFEIQQSLITQYGESAQGIDLVNGSLETQIALLGELSKQKADDYLNDIDREYGVNKVISAMEKESDYYLGTVRSIDKSTLQPLFDKYGISFDDNYYAFGSNEYQIYFTGNITDIQDKLSELRKEIKNISDEEVRDYLETNLIGGIDTVLDNADDVSKKYASIYNTIKTAQLILDDGAISTPYDENSKIKNPIDIYDDYAEAVDNFNQAVLKGDKEKSKQAKSELEAVQAVVDDMLSQDEYSQFASLFDAISESINKSAIAAINFNDVLDSGKYDKILENIGKYKKEDLSLISFDDSRTSMAEMYLRDIMDVAKEQGVIDEVSTVNIPIVLDYLIDRGNIKSIKSQTAGVSQDISATFKDVLKDGEKTPENLSDYVSSFTSEMETMKSALDQLKSGEFELSSVSDLIGNIPEIAGHTDSFEDLQNTLNSLSYDRLKEFVKGYSTYVNDITDITERAAATDYLNSLINQWNLSGTEINFNEFSSNALSSVSSTLERIDILDTLHKVYSEFGNTSEGLDIIAKLSLNPDAATWTFDQWKDKIENEEILVKIKSSEDVIEKLESELETLNAKSNANKAKYDAKGIDYDEKYYDDRIAESKENQSILRGIAIKRLVILNALKNSEDATTEDINQAMQAWSEARTNLWNEVANQAEYEKEKSALPITQMANEMEDLQTEAQKLNEVFDIKASNNLKTTASDYYALIVNSEKQIQNLRNSNDELRKSQEEYLKNVGASVNSSYYRDLQSQIDSNDASIREAILSQIEWNNAISNLPVENVQALSSAISSAITELNSGTGVTTDTMNTLITQFSDLKGMDTADLFYRTADGIKVDTKSLKEFCKAENEIVQRNFARQISDLNEEIAKGSKTAQEELETVLNRQAQYFAEYQKQLESISKLSQIDIAENTPNQGANYDTAKSKLKTWKSLYDEGRVGTDDFEAMAEYFNEYGVASVENFASDYARAARYLTEDAGTGINNFLDDLIANGLAVEDTAGNVAMNFKDMADAAHKMGMNEEFFTDMFGKAEEYGGYATIITSLEDAKLQTEDLSEQLYEAKKEYIDLKNQGADDTTLQQKQAEIDLINQQLSDVDEGTKAYVDNMKQEYADGFDSLKSNLQDYADAYKEAMDRGDLTSANKWLNDAQELADKYHVKLKGDFEVDEDSYQSGMEKLYSQPRGSWENPIQPTISGSEDVKNYASAYQKVIKAHQEDNSVLSDATSILSNYTAEQLKSINLDDGVYDSDNLKEAEMALDSLTDELGLTNEEAQMLWAILEAVGQTKVEPNVQFEDETLQNGLDQLQEMQENGEIDTKVNFQADTSSMDIDDLQERLEALEEIKVNIEPGSDAEATLDELISDTELQLKIKTVLENDSPEVDKLLSDIGNGNATDEQIMTVIGCDASEVDQVRETLDTIAEGKTIPLTVQLDEKQFEALTTNTTTANFDATQANSDINAYKENLDSIPETAPQGGTKVAVDNKEANSKIEETKVKLEALSKVVATPEITVISDEALRKISSISSLLNKLDGKHATTIIETRHINTFTSSNTGIGGPVMGTAHASGTAFMDMWTDYRHSIGAYAGGSNQNWALKKDETAIINEIGTESIVRDGKFMLVPGGAHFQQLKRGDIIFNAKQTAELLKYGKVISDGKHGTIAMANGTAYNTLNAYATGGLTVNRPGSNTGSSATSNSSNNSGNAITNTINRVTNAVTRNLETFQKWLEKLVDWVEVRIQRINDRIDLYTAQSENAIGYQNQNSLLARAQRWNDNLLRDQQAGRDRYLQQANQVTDEAIASHLLNGDNDTQRRVRANALIDRIQNGRININEYNENEREFITAYTEWYDRAVELNLAIEETIANQRDLEQQRFENIADEYDSIISMIEHRSNMINEQMSQNEAAGYVGSRAYYQLLAGDAHERQQRLQEEQRLLADDLQRSMNWGYIQYGDERWYAMQDQINQVSEELQSVNGELIEFNNNIRALEWEQFDRGQETISRLTDEFNFMIDLMSDEQLFDDMGQATNEGLATMGLHAGNYNVYMEQANEYAQEYQRIQRELAKDPYNTDLIERRNELLDLQQESIAAAEDEKQALRDLVQQGIDAELNSLQELIDKYKDALKSKKDLYDYQRDIADKTSEVSNLQKQINAFSMDTSEEGRLRLQQAQDALREAQENLQQTEYERYISDQEELLNNLYD